MKKLIIAIVTLSLITGTSYAATKSPTPTKKATAKATAKSTTKSTVKPSVKPTAKPTAKPSIKTTAKATGKSTVKATSKATAKTTSKATVATSKKPSAKATTKKVVTKPKPKPKPKRSKKLPPEKPEVWPPKGFAQSGDIFARNPTVEEAYLAAGKDKTGALAKQLIPCGEFICGAIFVGSAVGCEWWEVNSEVYGQVSDTDKTQVKYGDLKSVFKGSAPRKIIKLILVSEVPFNTYTDIYKIKVVCHREPIPADLKVPSHTYVKAEVTTP